MFPIFDALMPVIGKVLDKIPDAGERDRLRAEMQTDVLQVLQTSDQAQNDVNKQEAASQSFFIAGARPAALWLCVISLGYQGIVVPILTHFLIACGFHPSLPILDPNLQSTLLYGMLGLGALRSVDKIKGVA